MADVEPSHLTEEESTVHQNGNGTDSSPENLSSHNASIHLVDLDYHHERSGSALMSSMKIEDDVAGLQLKDLSVLVDDPEKHVGGYVSYNVSTKTTRGQFDNSEYSVRRRYQDFLWLRQRLEESYSTHIIPPLPEKKSFSKHFDRFSPEFLKSRQIALNKFLSRIADHPVMSFNDSLHIFLTAKHWELTSVKKQGPGTMSRMGESFKSMASSWMLKSREPEFQEIADYTKNFREKIAMLEQISDRVARERFELMEDFKDFSPIFRLWANSEEKLADPLFSMADAIDQNYNSLRTLLKAQDTRLTEPLREYILYSDAIKSALKHRDTIQMEYEVTLDELGRKKSEKEELEKPGGGRSFFGGNTEEARQEKLDKVDANIEELSKLVDSGHDRMECSNVDLKADIDRWHKNKREDFRDLFTEYADRHITHYQELEKPGGGRSFFGGNTEEARQEKLDKVDANIEELSKLVDSGHDRMECSNVDLKADIDRWHKNKREDFRDLFTEYADRHITHYQECLDAWEKVLGVLSGNGKEDNELES